MNNQMNNAVRKIHNLLSSGAVTVTGPNQPRILKQKVGATTVTPANNLQQQTTSNSNRCYVCDEALGASQAQHSLTEMQTSHTATKFPNKIGQLVGDAFMVIVSVEDVVCSRCTNLINYLDRLENDVERVRTNLMNLLHKKYGLNDEGGGGASPASPPNKMQKLNSGGTVTRTVTEDNTEGTRVRKILHSGTESTLGKQSPPVSAVQQIKISTQQQVQQQQQLATSAQPVQRKTTKIYKCLSCDYKTSDMRLFNTHYETCKHQNFQCKNCKKIFPNFGAMKQHMVREHNTPMDNTCAVCHYNFVNETALRKHMEINHSTNVIVTSTTTLPAGTAVAAAATAVDTNTSAPTTTSLYTCNHCQFKSTDKTLFDEHLRKHLSGAKPKPFKCRLCAQRFETREAATVHAKQHQPNYFKCGTCSMSFSKRELLVKHFEVHQQPATPPPQPQPVATAKQPTSTALTQKLLQETINEALSDSVVSVASTDVATTATTANNIRFFSCHICSLTFIQENYYNQHMETHRRGDKKSNVTGSAAAAPATTLSNSTSTLTTHSAGGAMLGDGGLSKAGEAAEVASDSHQMNSNTVGTAGISEADIESIFEKMHSDKGDATGAESVAATSAASTNTTTTAATVSGGKAGEMVITSQAGSDGITFNITLPQPDGAMEHTGHEKPTATSTAPVSVSIDMPVLDHPDEALSAGSSSKTDAQEQKESVGKTGEGKTTGTNSGPVSMPSLDDDNETQEHCQASGEAGVSAGASESAHQEHAEGDPNHETHTQEQKAAEGSTTEASADSGADEGGGGQTHDGANEESEAAGGQDHQVSMELDEAMQAQVESGQIKFILNENGQLLQLDNHIITDADGNQILVQDPEQIQQLLQSVGVLQSGDGLDGETLQMMTDANGQMVLVQGENNETQLIDASLLNADGQLVIQQGQDGELGEGAHVIGEDGTRIPVSVSYTADGQPIVQVQQQVLEAASGEGAQHVLEKEAGAEGGTDTEAEAGDASAGGAAASSGGYFALEDLMQPQSSEAKTAE